jgi:hypothetical protein
MGFSNSAKDWARKTRVGLGAAAMASPAVKAVTAPIKPAILLSILHLPQELAARFSRLSTKKKEELSGQSLSPAAAPA